MKKPGEDMTRPHPHIKSDYAHHHDITTRWMDNDVYGHVNNVIYYSWFDTVVNNWLMARDLLDFQAGDMIGLVVETSCAYFAPLAFPQTVTAGLRVGSVGSSSVRYEVGLFGATDTAAAQGHFVHVYVDRHSRRPRPLPDSWRDALGTLQNRAL
jgi:acyl-CoA thioester hydrolase